MDDSAASLVDGLRRGDASAFDDAYARFRPRIFSFLWRLARDPEIAMDLLQETFIRLARHATELAPDTRLDAWLFTVARNAYRSHRRWAVLDASRWVVLDEDVPLPSAAADPEESLDAARARHRLERAIARLPDRDREILLLVAVEGMTHDEAGAILAISVENARQRLSRARARLQATMARLEKRNP